MSVVALFSLALALGHLLFALSHHDESPSQGHDQTSRLTTPDRHHHLAGDVPVAVALPVQVQVQVQVLVLFQAQPLAAEAVAAAVRGEHLGPH